MPLSASFLCRDRTWWGKEKVGECFVFFFYPSPSDVLVIVDNHITTAVESGRWGSRPAIVLSFSMAAGG